MTAINFRRLCISLVLGSLVALGSFSIASADGPIITGPTHFEGSGELWDCGSFKIIDNYVEDFTVKRFFDEAGHVERIIIQQRVTDTFTKSVTGKAYSGSVSNSRIFDFQGHGIGAVSAGLNYRLTVPGAGAILLEVGVFAYIRDSNMTILAGPHQVLEGDLAGLCAALA